MKKNTRKLILALMAVVAVAALLAAVWLSSRPAVTAGDKTFTVQVTHADGEEKTFTYVTDAEYLGQVLLEEGLIEGEDGEFGLYINAVDGETASWDEDSAYWALYEGDDYAMQGVDQTPVTDGGSYGLVYTVG